MGSGNVPPPDEPGFLEDPDDPSDLEETRPTPAVGGEPTQMIPRVVPAGPGGPPPGGPPPPFGPPPGDNRRRNLWLIVAGVFVLGIAIGALVVWLGHDDSKSSTSPTTDASSTSSSSSSTSTSTSESTTSSTEATTTTAAAAVQITSFQATSATPNCSAPAPAPGVSTSVAPTVQQVTLTWSTQNATSVDISVDGPGVYQSNVSGSTITIPYGCPGPHEYLLTAHGQGGTATTKSITISSS